MDEYEEHLIKSAAHFEGFVVGGALMTVICIALFFIFG